MISDAIRNVLNLFSQVQDTSGILQVPSSSLSSLSSLDILTWLSRSNAYLFMVSLIQSPITHQILLYLSILYLPFLACYLKTWQSFVAQCSDTSPAREPPTVPYMIPFFGRTVDSIINIRKFFHGLNDQTVYGAKIFGYKIFFIQGPEMISALWKIKETITAPVHQVLVLNKIFGMSSKAVQTYVLDESGLNAKSHPQSKIETHNRVDYITHVGFLRLLTGDGLPGLYRRWSLEFSCEIQALGISQEWSEHTDIMKFLELPLIASMNKAIAGPLLEAINPDFTEEFLEFLPYANQLVKSFPPWLIPRAYRLRKKLVATVKTWHSIARSQFKDHYVDADGDADPWWGSRCIRERQECLSKVDNWDYDSMAVSDFGLLWGASINVHKAAIWAVIEIFKDPALLSRVRKELHDASFDSESLASPQFIHKLIRIPLLQSIYAEVIRLHVEVQHVLYSHHSPVHINQWIFPKKTPILVPCGPAHHDAKVWNTRNGEFPLNTFWADRFLLYPEEAMSGPMITTPSSNGVSQFMSSSRPKNSSKPIYCESVMRNSFIGYGVGERTCPGRFLAKREIIAVFARIVQQYDIELLTKEKHFKHSMAFYGFGTQAPKNKIPFRIKRRER
ncbi:uncharacterized protein EAE98_002083 [Botrytis deweyae]|uniref:Cytochrome P450 n=1 Tax=Botrytis deweyae TaxID=2478750 RepID=A0ABQ7IWB1_9HELO|nr:uncharacterized protein EAE98_002083 [Botrytis deweyae]KAF7935863.1 hypothetical protein EAE98_002083 [Botrytis deweyae]